MFKISEVAGKLNVETYVIFEKLLTHAELLKDHTQKIHSISYIDEQGIEIIHALIEGRNPEKVVSFQTEEVIETQSEEIEEAASSDMERVTSTAQEEEDEDWLTEDDFILIDSEKAKLRDEVSQLRQQLIQYDSELKRLDDAFANYQILMREDVDYLMELEEKLETMLFRKSIQNDAREESTGMFGFRRK